MAQLISLSEIAITSIAQQVGNLLDNGIVSLDRSEQLQIAEGLPIWLLPATNVFNDTPDERYLLTGYWHFQIHDNDKPRAFARAKIIGPTDKDWLVSSVFESNLVSNIDEAISVIDKMEIDGEARLLEIPAWLISVIWINNDTDNTYLIVNTGKSDDIPLLRPLSEIEILSLLRATTLVEGRIPNS